MLLTSPAIIQVAWVTEDPAALESLLHDRFGCGPWTRLPGIEFGPDSCVFRGEPSDFVADISLAYAADLQLEVIRPVRGESIYTEFLTAHGAGLHHVCYQVDDLAAAMTEAEAEGLPVVQHGVMAGGSLKFAYLDGAQFGAPYLELAEIGPDMQAFFDSLKAAR